MKLRNLELSAANYLSKFPKIKYLVKICYLIIAYIFYKKNFKINSEYQIFKLEHKKHAESFFGYYDICPINDDGLIIYHQSNAPTYKNPNLNYEVTISVYDLYRKKNVYSTETINATIF